MVHFWETFLFISRSGDANFYLSSRTWTEIISGIWVQRKGMQDCFLLTLSQRKNDCLSIFTSLSAPAQTDFELIFSHLGCNLSILWYHICWNIGFNLCIFAKKERASVWYLKRLLWDIAISLKDFSSTPPVLDVLLSESEAGSSARLGQGNFSVGRHVFEDS